MGQYDQSKDKLLKLFELKKEKSSVLCSVFSYDGGQPKLGLTRSFQKQDGTVGYGQIGRISIEEAEFLREKIDEIIEIMKNYKKSEKLS